MKRVVPDAKKNLRVALTAAGVFVAMVGFA